MAGKTRRSFRDVQCQVCGSRYPFFSHKQTTCSDECRFRLYQNAGAADACWEWGGNRNNSGYGVLSVKEEDGRRTVMAHRFSFLRSGGVLTTEKPCVLHRCDNRRCTNPAHLFAGDWVDNNKDRSAKGRSGKRVYSAAERNHDSLMLRGENNHTALLTEQQARAIKYGHPELSGREVGALYGVSKITANFIRRGVSWRHL